MIVTRDRHSRGRTELGWLDSRHTFSFGHDHDPEHMGFGALTATSCVKATAPSLMNERSLAIRITAAKCCSSSSNEP